MADFVLTTRCIPHLVIGSGAAGFQAAARLRQEGAEGVALLTEQVNAGTSRNTGSDKQTYYKLSLAGGDGDSVLAMARDLFAGQCVDGDQALCEAALSVRCFYHLVELGVPFPCDDYGQAVGYKTDHDRGRRATSVGPYTSRAMTEALEGEVRRLGIPILDGLQAIRLFSRQGRLRAVLCLDRVKTRTRHKPCYQLLFCSSCILATGGPAGLYRDSVYPASQLGSTGLALEAGAKGKNLTEWQYGLASLQPRWNVSGTYMQVLPRVISTRPDGTDEREFLLDWFGDTNRMQSLLFLKGYQWPFDVNKIFGGSSLIDLLVYRESCLLGRRVFLDYRSNSGGQEVDFGALDPEARDYLQRAGACFGTPIQRLEQMNQPAVAFYREHGVDLHTQPLEIALCAQHNNGGLAADAHWQTDLPGLYVAGEVCGSHGVTRPGGTALNAGQVGALRAAEHIARCARRGTLPPAAEEETITAEARAFVRQAEACQGKETTAALWQRATARMSRCGAMIREEAGLTEALAQARQDLAELPRRLAAPTPEGLGAYYHLRDMLLTQVVCLSAMLDYLHSGGGSRGSALYTDPAGDLPAEGLPELFRCKLDRGAHGDRVQEVGWTPSGTVQARWRPVRPIPEPDDFFENVWKEDRARRA